MFAVFTKAMKDQMVLVDVKAGALFYLREEPLYRIRCHFNIRSTPGADQVMVMGTPNIDLKNTLLVQHGTGHQLHLA